MKVSFLSLSVILISTTDAALGDRWPFCLNPKWFKSSMETNSFDVSLEQYSGIWYEQWHMLPSFLSQQQDCICTAVKYTLEDNGDIGVSNRCVNKNDQEWGGINGSLEVDNPPRNTKGFVYFFTEYIGRRFIPYITGAYWILAMDEDYQWALIGEPCKQSIYFLTRQRDNVDDHIEMSMSLAEEKFGYHLDNMEMTMQDECPDLPFDTEAEENNLERLG